VDVSRIAKQLTASLEREAQDILLRGCDAGGSHGYPVVDVKVNVLEYRHNDPPDPAVPLLGTLTLAVREAIAQSQTIVLEPVMRLEVRVPDECLGAIMKDLGSRRAESAKRIWPAASLWCAAWCPLPKFRLLHTDASLTQGRGSFSMEPYDYQPARSWV
jgi:elongation factor G